MEHKFTKKNLIFLLVLFLLSILTIALIAGGLNLRNRLDNERVKAGELVYNCDVSSLNIDVSMCPNYSNYANNENANSAVFFNSIFYQAYAARTNPLDEIVIKIPAAKFYFFTNPNNTIESNKITLYGIYNNFVIEGSSYSQRPTFIDKDENVDKDYLFLAQGGRNLKLKNIIFEGNSKNKYTRGLISVINMAGNIYIDNINCSGTYRDIANYHLKSNVCLQIREHPDYQPSISADYVEVTNSVFKSYDVALATSNIKRVNLSNNTFDNTDPCPECVFHHHRGSVSLASNFTNKDGTSDRSSISNNTFISNGKVDGQTGIAIVGQSNKIDITKNILENVQDRAIFVSSHVLNIDPPCHGGPKDITIVGNTIIGTGTIADGSTIEGISIINQPATDCDGDIEKATIRNISIADNTIKGVKGGVELSSTPHAPLYAVDVHNNTIKDSGIVYPNSWFGNNSLTGGCITLFGLKGENNNARDIKIYNNSLKSCGLGIYFVASYWPISDNNSGLVNYTTQNQQNEYVSVYNNVIDNFGPLAYTPEAAPNKVDIVVQAEPVPGIGNRDSIVMYNNLIKTDPKSTTFDNRCNTVCISNNDCLETVSTLYGSGTNIVSGYPNSYVCSVGKCRNRDDINDDNCDLNDQNSTTNKAPIINAGVDQVITLPSRVNLLGTARDDGLPNGTQSLTSTWSKISGNGTVTFANVNALTTTATFSNPGIYTLKLSVSDSIFTTTENVIVTVMQPIQSVEAPVFSSMSTQFEFMDTLIVYLSTPTSGALIRYTTDESDPTTTRGILYSEPISISTTTTFKAIAYKEGMDNSNVVTQTYTKSSQQPTSSLVIYAKGTRALQDITSTSVCQNGYPNMVVKYNDGEIGRICLDETSPSDGYKYSIDVPNADPSKLTIHFTNDFYVANIEDRNMIIEKIVLNGTETILPSELVYAKGSWTSTYGCGLDIERPMTSSNRLGCSGYVRLRQQ